MISLFRTTIVTGVLAGLVILGFVQIRASSRERLITELETLNREMEARLAAKAQQVERLSRTRRVAHLVIGPQSRAADGTISDTTLELIELDEDGGEIARQSFTVPGAVVYLDALTVRFDPSDVAAGHPLRGRTLVLLRRIFSEQLAPADGPVIDTPGAAPPAYAVGEASRFEQQLWTHFWDLATDAALAARMGVRVAQGEAVYKRVTEGQRYELTVEAVGGLSLAPLDALGHHADGT